MAAFAETRDMILAFASAGRCDERPASSPLTTFSISSFDATPATTFINEWNAL